MILVDVNILLYASNAESDRYSAASAWLDAQLNGSARVGLPWASLASFLRISTNPRIFPKPLPMELAWRQVTHWLSVGNVWTPAPTERHATVLGNLLALPGVNSNLVHDAHLAALAIEHGLTLCSSDGDFARFRALRWLNPIGD